MFDAPAVHPSFDGPWQAFRREVDGWYQRERSRLREPWPDSMDDATLLSFELGFYVHGSSDDAAPYDVTPQPGWIFAHTGGDGEHLTVLADSVAAGRVVFTAPMAFDFPNLVVGSSFEDFLGVLCAVGMSALTKVCYLGGPSEIDEVSPAPSELHVHLRTALALDPTDNVLAHLRSLNC